jgi:hypothetical protein
VRRVGQRIGNWYAVFYAVVSGEFHRITAHPEHADAFLLQGACQLHPSLLICLASGAAWRESDDEEPGIRRRQSYPLETAIEGETRRHLDMCSGSDLRSKDFLQAPVLLAKVDVRCEHPQRRKPNEDLQHFAESDGPNFGCRALGGLVEFV